MVTKVNKKSSLSTPLPHREGQGGESTFLDLVKARYSVRSYTNQAIEKEKLDYIMECVRLAPSAVNFQPWKFYIVESDEAKSKLCQCYTREWFATAPLYIMACADHTQSWKRRHEGKDHADVDISIAVEHLCLAATEQGLGTCWVCAFDAALCKSLFDLPEHIEPIALIPLGYPADEAKEKSRKAMEKILFKL